MYLKITASPRREGHLPVRIGIPVHSIFDTDVVGLEIDTPYPLVLVFFSYPSSVSLSLSPIRTSFFSTCRLELCQGTAGRAICGISPARVVTRVNACGQSQPWFERKQRHVCRD
jgi:hypothetical protein